MALEKMLTGLLGLVVNVAHKKSGAGEVRIRYANLEQLDAITRRLQTP
jgi:ParB family chromosome partitioning protein